MPLRLPKSHDHFVRFSLSDRELAKSFFKKFLQGKILNHLDLDRLQNAKETYIGEKLNESIADLLYAIPFKQGDDVVHVQLEHKSSGSTRLNRDSHILPYQLRAREMLIFGNAFIADRA